MLPDSLVAKWNVVVSVAALFNTVQSFLTPKLTKRVYSNTNEVNGLQGRTFGIWTLLSAIVRFYCAYHITNPDVYFLCQCTYYLACFHFLSEWLLFRTTNLGPGLLSPIVVSTVSIWFMAKEKASILGIAA